MSEWRKPERADCVSGVPYLGLNEDGDLRMTWWGKTSHVPLFGWCYGDDPEDMNLWEPTLIMRIPPPPPKDTPTP